MPISSGAASTSSVTAQSRNRCGQTARPNAALVRCSICTPDRGAAEGCAEAAEPEPAARVLGLASACNWLQHEPDDLEVAADVAGKLGRDGGSGPAGRSWSQATDRRTVRVQGGATLGDVDRETHLRGPAVPAGVVWRPGIAGLTLGGGVGWLARKYGMTCDNVLSFEVVAADSAVVTADAEHHPDLLWALQAAATTSGSSPPSSTGAPGGDRSGGPDRPCRDQAGAVIRHYRDFMASAPDELTAYAGLLCTPDGAPAVGVIACYCGDPAEGARVLRPLRAFGTPLADTIQPLPFPAMQTILDGAFSDGTFNYWKSTFLTGLGGRGDRAHGRAPNRAGSPLSAVVIEMYGGAAGRVGAGETAFAQRQAEYDIGMMAQWTDRADTDRQVAWARGLYEALKPYSSGSYLLNFLAEESPDTILAAFGRNYPRLVEVKDKYDPTNFFSLNQNVHPSV